jgi:hypothetical protein
MVRIAGARWSIDPGFGCVDLQGTVWARMGQLQWCPTLAQMMSQEVVWPGVTHRDKVLAEINKVAGREIAKLVLDIATGQVEDRPPTPEEEGKDPAAVSLGRRGGLKGGKARADKLTAEQRADIARKAAKARWEK